MVVTVDFAQNQPERPWSRLEEGEFFEAFASERDNSLTKGFWDPARLFAPVVRIEGWKEGVRADLAPRVGLKIASKFSKRPKGINGAY